MTYAETSPAGVAVLVFTLPLALTPASLKHTILPEGPCTNFSKGGMLLATGVHHFFFHFNLLLNNMYCSKLYVLDRPFLTWSSWSPWRSVDRFQGVRVPGWGEGGLQFYFTNLSQKFSFPMNN